MRSAAPSMLTNMRCSGSGVPGGSLASTTPIEALIAVSGVRRSCETLAKNSSFWRSRSRCAVTSRSVSTAPRRGAVVGQHRRGAALDDHLRAVGPAEPPLGVRHRLAAAGGARQRRLDRAAGPPAGGGRGRRRAQRPIVARGQPEQARGGRVGEDDPARRVGDHDAVGDLAEDGRPLGRQRLGLAPRGSLAAQRRARLAEQPGVVGGGGDPPGQVLGQGAVGRTEARAGRP